MIIMKINSINDQLTSSQIIKVTVVLLYIINDTSKIEIRLY